MDASQFRVEIEFQIESRKVLMRTEAEHTPEETTDRGWIFGLCVVEVMQSLRPHFMGDEWESFLLALDQMGAD